MSQSNEKRRPDHEEEQRKLITKIDEDAEAARDCLSALRQLTLALRRRNRTMTAEECMAIEMAAQQAEYITLSIMSMCKTLRRAAEPRDITVAKESDTELEKKVRAEQLCKENSEYFYANLDKWLQDKLIRGKYVVIYDKKLQGSFDNHENAIKFAMRLWPEFGFAVQEVRDTNKDVNSPRIWHG